MPAVWVGRIGRAHGLQGEVRLDECSLSVDELLELRTFTWRGRDGVTRPLTLAGARPTHDRLIVSFQGIQDREAAATLAQGHLEVEADRLPDAGPGMAYTFQLIGLAVDTVEGKRLGLLESILPTGANRVFVIRGEREWLVPATDDVVRRVDLQAGIITVDLPPGLEDV